MKAIAAMALNRVIGQSGKIPWHLPEDFRWFKKTTTGHAVLMGRKTFASLGKPLPNRTNIVLTRGPQIPGVLTISHPNEIPALDCEIFVIGGAEIYALLLPQCTDLYLSLVRRRVEGDTFFPEFESRFYVDRVVLDLPEFEVRHYRKRLKLQSCVQAKPTGCQEEGV